MIHDERGNALVEFALSASILFVVLFGIMETSRAIYSYHFVTYAAQEGARYAVVHGGDWPNVCSSTVIFGCKASDSDVQTYVRNLTPPGLDSSSVTVTRTWLNTSPNCTSSCTCAPNLRGCYVKVKVAYSFSFSVPFLPTSALNLVGTSVKVIQQ